MPDSPAAGNAASAVPVDALTTAAEVIAIELRKVPWIGAAPERLRALAFDCAARALDLAAPAIRQAERERWARHHEQISREAVDAERQRSEALIIQAQDYASAESERADKLAALALKILNQCQALHPTGEADYLDEWGMALDQLESGAGEMSPPDSDPLEEASQAGIKWERERIISLASQLRASFPADHPKGAQASFADYLRVTSADLPEATDG